MNRRPQRIFTTSVVALVGLALVVITAFAPEGTSRDSVRRFADENPKVGVRLTLDTLDAARGLLRVRVAIDSDALPAQGATLFTDLPGLTKVSLPVDSVKAESASEVLVEAGDIADYPYDLYVH